MTIKFSTYINPAAVLIAVMFSLQLNAQRGSKWRVSKDDSAKCDTVTVVDTPSIDSLYNSELLDLSSLPAEVVPGVFTLRMDSTISEIDSITRLSIKPLIGVRIQIFWGPLSQARELQAQFRKDNHGTDVYLASNGPMYTVSVGNYRTKWDAQNDYLKLVKKYREALILESEIDLPGLY